MEKRILVVCQRYWPENGKLIDICEGLTERGIKVDVICGQPLFSSVHRSKQKKIKGDKEIRGGVRVIRSFETDAENDGSLAIFTNMLSFRLSSMRALKKVDGKEYDKVLIYQVSPVTMCAAGLKLAKKRGIGSLLYVSELWPHTIEDELDVRNRLFERFLEAVSAHYYKAADRLIVNTENTREYFLNALKINEDRVIYIPQCAEKLFSEHAVDNDLLDRFAGSFNIVYIGEVGDRQRFLTLIEAAEQIKKNGIKNIRFIIAGSGKNIGAFRQEVQKRQLREMFFFEGAKHEKEIPVYLNLADCLFDTRRAGEAEDFYVPDKLASYMAAGRPLLLSMGGEAGEIVKEAGCGFVSEPEDPEALFDDIMRLYNMNRNERRVLGINAMEYQREHFNRDKAIDLLIDELYPATEDVKEEGEETSSEGSEFNWIDDSFR